MRLVHIQTLRFIAAAAVVSFHSLGAAKLYLSIDKSPLFEILRYGYFGVDLFFVISGFIIYYTTHAANITSGIFLARRVERIVPLYWSVTIFWCLLGLVVPSLFKVTDWLSADNVARSLTFTMFTSGRFPIVFIGWSLEYEMFFYLCVAFVLAVGEWAWSIVTLAFSSLILLGCFYHPSVRSASYAFITNPLLLESASWWRGYIVDEGRRSGRFLPFLPLLSHQQ